jgi:uncharacterized protein YjiS (DUF1127 family)
MQASNAIGARRIQAPAGHALMIVLFGAVAGFYRILARALSGIAAARRQARLRSELHGLNDHILRDIGLRRDQIDRLFR